MLAAQVVPTGAGDVCCIPFMALITEESFLSVLGWLSTIKDCCEVCPCALLTTAGAAEGVDWILVCFSSGFGCRDKCKSEEFAFI